MGILAFATLAFSHFCLTTIKLPDGFVPPCLFKNYDLRNQIKNYINDDNSDDMGNQHCSYDLNFCPVPQEPKLEVVSQYFGK